MVIDLDTPTYESDVLLISPLSLRLLTGIDGEKKVEEDKKVDFDFLSSLDFLVLDQAEAFNF